MQDRHTGLIGEDMFAKCHLLANHYPICIKHKITALKAV